MGLQSYHWQHRRGLLHRRVSNVFKSNNASGILRRLCMIVHVPFKSTYLPHFLSHYHTCWLFLHFYWCSESKRLPKPPLLAAGPPLLLGPPCNSMCHSKLITQPFQSTSKSKCSSGTTHSVEILIKWLKFEACIQFEVRLRRKELSGQPLQLPRLLLPPSLAPVKKGFECISEGHGENSNPNLKHRRNMFVTF